MIDVNLNDSDIEANMKSIKSYLLDENNSPKIFQAHTVAQKNYLKHFDPNANEIRQFTEEMREILEILKKNAINQMLIILNDYLLFLNEEAKVEADFSSILGENWETQLTYFNQIQTIKENIMNQIKTIGNANEFKSKISQIFEKLNNSIDLFHNGYIANLFLLIHNQANNFNSYDHPNSQITPNPFDKSDSIYNEYDCIHNVELESNSNPQPLFNFYEFYNIIQSNKKTRLTKKIHLEDFYNPFYEIDNEQKKKSTSKEEAKMKEEENERKLRAYRKLYIKKRQEKLNELIKKKKEEAKQEFILSYRKQLLEEKKKYQIDCEKQEEISKLRSKLEYLEQKSTESLNDLVQQIESSKLVDLSKVSKNNPESIQKVLQEKIDYLNSLNQKSFEEEMTEAENELNNSKDEIFVKNVKLMQTINQINIQKEKAAQNQSKTENQADKFEKLQKESLDCAFSIYVFFLKYRENILKLPNPKNLIYPSNSELPYPENYKNEFERIVNKNGLEWLISELRSLL